MSISRDEALEQAEQLKKERAYNDIISLLTPFYESRKTIDVACYLIYAFRRFQDFDNCNKICDEMDALNGLSSRILNQRKWCKLFQTVIYQKDNNVASNNAKTILSNLNQNNSYDLFLAKFMCFHLADRLTEIKNFEESYFWLCQIKSDKLNNQVRYFIKDDEGSYENPERRVHSEKYMYYHKLAFLTYNSGLFDDFIIGLLLKYSPAAKNNFLNSLKNRTISENGNLNFYLLASIIMVLREEDSIMAKAVGKNIKNLVVSDISNFVFCPVSSAINKSLFDVPSLTSLDIDERLSFRRKHLNDFYEIYNNSKGLSITASFKSSLDSDFTFNNNDLLIITRILNAKRVGQNIQGSAFQNYIFQNDDISGSPDMVLVDTENFLVEEVYTNNKLSSLDKPFENDHIKMIGYLYEMELKYGYLFYWNTRSVSIENTYKKQSLITGLKIFRIEKNNIMVQKYIDVKAEVKSFFINQNYNFSPNKINYNKCISCSSIHYCNNKRGHLDSITIPYQNSYA